MTVKRKGFLRPLSDNEELYLSNLIGYVESIDINCSMLIEQYSGVISFRVAPSQAEYTEPLMRGIKGINNTFGMKVEFSKSIKTSMAINFSITK